ncbi:MAG: redoxin domain-containing protein [Candidatus Peribacteraceae bacterium]|nr:redoxin domain-containing protein [Candidatus Peribacteraceae bacterium]
MTLFFTLFFAGMLTILLPCILPLVPIVLGVTVSSRNKWQPLITVLGVLVSFVGFNFLLIVVLKQFVALADYTRIGAYYVLLLMGIGFVFHKREITFPAAIAGALFFYDKGWPAVVVAAIIGVIAMEIGGRVGTGIQQLGTDVQNKTRATLGSSYITYFIIGLTLGLVWVPCAGPALAFALTLVREKPGAEAFALLLAYGAGACVPLLIIGYGGRYMLSSARLLNKYTERIKLIFGVIMILSAIAFRLDLFTSIQVYLAENTSIGTIGTDIEQKLFKQEMPDAPLPPTVTTTMSASSKNSMKLPTLPKLIRAPEFTELGPWHNSEPFTLASQKGKVVLVDFWTYSCINCIRTLPYIQGYWDKFKDTGKFTLIGVHSPEFIFEKDEKNVAGAIKKRGLTYPTAQDNNFGTWKAFANRYWPAKYLIDADGYIRYTHFGEGAYDETDLAIQSLLQEAGVKVDGKAEEVVQAGRKGDVSPETYIGSRSWPVFGNKFGDPDASKAYTYTAPTKTELNKFYLVGNWMLVDQEQQTLQSPEGEIRMRFTGSEMNLVLGLDEGVESVNADILIDGKLSKSITIDMHDLYNLYKGDYGEHEMILKLHGKGAQAYAFTFGGN